MDKNIIALVREDTKTVKVKFFPDMLADGNSANYDRYARELAGKEYTYVTNFECKAGDLALVFVGKRPAVVEIQKVDPNLDILAGDSRVYKWIVAVIDLAPYEKLCDQNAKLEELLQTEYQKNIRRQFREVFLAASSTDVIKQLDEILK